jgi:hypothetical protein
MKSIDELALESQSKRNLSDETKKTFHIVDSTKRAASKFNPIAVVLLLKTVVGK